MKEVIHRLLLFIVWGCTALFCFLVYDGFKRDDETVVEMLMDHYETYVYALLIAFVLSLCFNWIMTGDRNNWARKPQKDPDSFFDD